MTLDAKVRFILLQEIVCNRAMGCVADCTILNNRGVFKGVGTTFILVALQTKFVLVFFCPKKWAHFRTMGIVAVGAYKLPFLHWMVVWIPCLS